jgi:DNA-binding CsgD family transcriptional regulator
MNARGEKLLTKAVAYHLTRRQLEIAMLLAAGFALKEIADKLNLNIRTVVSHCGGLKQKMGTPNTLSAIVKLLD